MVWAFRLDAQVLTKNKIKLPRLHIVVGFKVWRSIYSFFYLPLFL